ncbi:hypothetical protein CDL12_03471 [Handroanthus impetiginosus]|uniref:Uncharacterized protein n=1 Tax=Handroanthus impetiginosus TaxID=429701 RepID=A0A2G9I224_9LAMI|nr:hypothetical protein CDL12_03471 [Handroanthus impetiginosus]
MGRYGRPWLLLANSLDMKEWSQEVSLSKTKEAWILLAAHYLRSNELICHQQSSSIEKAFFEVQCPLTNTLLTSFKELSIFLWDLHSLTSFLLTRSLYDKVIPSLEELTGVDQTNNRFIPYFCKYLFHVYHLLRKSNVGGQFSKKNMKYRQSPPCKEKKKAHQKLTHNPSGDFDAHQEWTTMEEIPF